MSEATMTTLKMHEMLGRRVLVTRDSARTMLPKLAAALAEGCGQVALDCSGVAGMTPSFLDETLSIIEQCMATAGNRQLRVTVENPPTELSSKYAAVGRAHNLAVEESSSGAWVISRREDENRCLGKSQ